MTHDTEWYYNLVTGQVEQYEGGKAVDRLGPYATRQEAEQALARVRGELEALTLWNDPGNVYLHCLCEAP